MMKPTDEFVVSEIGFCFHVHRHVFLGDDPIYDGANSSLNPEFLGEIKIINHGLDLNIFAHRFI